MGWKVIKRYLDYIGIESANPRGYFKEALSQKIIQDDKIWIDMIEQKNLLSHIYDEDEIKETIGKIVDSNNASKDLLLSLEERLKNEGEFSPC